MGQGKENIGNRWVLVERVHTTENILEAHIYLRGCLIKYDNRLLNFTNIHKQTRNFDKFQTNVLLMEKPGS